MHLPLGPLWEEDLKSLKWRKRKREKQIRRRRRRRRRRCSGRGNDEE